MFQVEICSQQLEICKSCACLSTSPLLWRLINFRLFCSDDCRSWPREEKINNHGCRGRHAHIPDNDYWGICLFYVVWTNFLQLILCGIHGIYIYYFHQPQSVWFKVYNAIFNSISIISWLSVLLMEGTGVPWKNHRPVASHWQTLSHNIVSSTLK